MNDLTQVRSEDRFDLEAVHSWLVEVIPELGSLPTVEQFRSGASNLTYLLTYPDRQLVLRKPPFGTKAASAHDMTREFAVQKKLKEVFPLVPDVLALCQDPSVIGTDFYVMEKIPGTILRRNIPENSNLDIAAITTIGNLAITGLVQLHQIDSNILADFNKGSGYVSRQVEGWSRRYRAALTPDVPDAEILMNWLHVNQPKDIASCVIHGDWRLDNLVFDMKETPALVGVLDWEMATVGDPLMDLGSALAYWIDRNDEGPFTQLRRQPSHLPGMPTREEFVHRYLELTNWECDDFTFYEVFGLFRLTVIVQQIWARYQSGQTTNPAFSDFGSTVHLLVTRALGKIS